VSAIACCTCPTPLIRSRQARAAAAAASPEGCFECCAPARPAWSPGRPRGGARRQALQRRLRILTVPLAVARAPRDLYASADADAILVMLAHKTAVRALLMHVPLVCPPV